MNTHLYSHHRLDTLYNRLMWCGGLIGLVRLQVHQTRLFSVLGDGLIGLAVLDR